MRTYQPDAATRWLLIAALLVVLLRLMACASPGRPTIGGPAREQPESLVGFWLSDPVGDSGTILVLRRDAPRWTQRQWLRLRGQAAAWWWVEQRRPDEPARLCLHWRAGRDPADCAPFHLDTLVADSGRLVRLSWKDRRFVAPLH